MDIPVPMPQLGNEITEAEVTEWVKFEGDFVDKNEFIVLITTTKMSLEIESPAAGILKILVQEGEIAPVGATLALLEPCQ